MHDQLKGQFDQAAAQFKGEDRSAKVVSSAWGNFEKDFYPNMAHGDYPSPAVSKLSEYIHEAVLGQKDLDKGNNATDPDEAQRFRASAQVHTDKYIHGMTALADAPSGGSSPSGNPVKPEDIKKMTDDVTNSIRASMHDNPDPAPYKPGTQTPSGALAQPSSQNSPAGLINNAQDQLFKGDPTAALSSINKAIDLGAGPAALAIRGGIEFDQGQYSKASQDAEQALQKDPTNKEAIAVKHFAEGRIDGSNSSGPSAANAGVAGPGGASGAAGGAGGFSSFGSGASGSSGVGSADKFAGIAGSLGSSHGTPSSAILAGMSSGQAQKAGQNALGMKDNAAAMAFADRAIAQDPKNPSSFNLRSSIYAQQREYGKAVEDAKAGLALSPKDPELLRSLGFAQLRDKDYKGALATANEMLELNPNDPYAYAIRGHAYGSMGDRDAMMADLKRAAELDPSFREAAAKMEGQLQLPSDQDILFLFPGEEATAAANTNAPAGGKPRLFGLLVGASVLGGLLLAFVLLNTVFAPLKAQVSSAITRITRTGPTIGAEIDNDTISPHR